MLFRKVIIGIVLSVIILLPACAAPDGSIVILEDPDESSFTMDFTKYNGKSKCELSLDDGDVLQVEVTRDSGEIAFSISGKNGSEPYTGNDLESITFTTAVSETDEYVFRINGKDATGKILVKKCNNY